MSVAARNRAADRHDTGTAAGKAFLDMLAVFVEFETKLRTKQQTERIAAAKARGVYKGRSFRMPFRSCTVVPIGRGGRSVGNRAIGLHIGLLAASLAAN